MFTSGFPVETCDGTATPVRFDGGSISAKDIADISRRRFGVVLGADAAFRARIRGGANFVADLFDRQLALLVDSQFNRGLPANLSGARGERAAIGHGLKALQMSVSASRADALKATMPVSVFPRSSECHNQHKVSMETIAPRDCLRVLEQTEQVVAAMPIARCTRRQRPLHPTPALAGLVRRTLRAHRVR